MSPVFWVKLGMLFNAIDEFLIKVDRDEVAQGDLDFLKALIKEVKKKFYESHSIETKDIK